MVAQPSGTVTLVFTDVEGSTRLLHELGRDSYLRALDEQRGIVRAACAHHDGYEVDEAGDGFFYAFAAAGDAVAAVEEAMAALALSPIRVRAGIHAGEPGLDAPKYVGVDVHKAARIMAAGHGGQVLLSQATRGLVDGWELLDLGEHRLKDFGEPVRLFQLGGAAFPPLRTLGNTNLPVPASSFVGREQEIAEIASLLRNRGNRLVTLAGPGGSGKTRLAIEAAAEVVGDYPDGVVWVALASLRDPALVADTVAETLGSRAGLAEQIGDRGVLLVLDNFEHVIDAATDLAELLGDCANLRVLVTSRELLRLQGEIAYQVPPLDATDAEKLFSARSQLPRDEDIADLCRQLDDLPLAVELAAARTTVLSPAQIRERLSRRLDLFKGGRDADPRQQTLRATIDWSYQLLDEQDRRLFACLGVFVGGCTLQAAEQIADADLDLLQSLVEKSLVRHSSGRFWMLETILEYSVERLNSLPDCHDVRRRHADYVLGVFREIRQDNDDLPSLLEGASREHDNLRAALEWADDAAERDLQLELVVAGHYYWVIRGPRREGYQHFERALAANRQKTHLRVEALVDACDLAISAGAFAEAKKFGEESLEVARELGDDSGEVRALHALAEVAIETGDYDQACQLLHEQIRLRSALGEPSSKPFNVLSANALAQADYPAAKTFAEQALALAPGIGRRSVAIALHNLAEADIGMGRHLVAKQLLSDSVELYLQLGERSGLSVCLELFAAIAVAEHDYKHAARLLAVAGAQREEDNDRLERGEQLVHDQTLAAVTAALDDAELERAWEEGRATGLENSLTAALSRAQNPSNDQ